MPCYPLRKTRLIEAPVDDHIISQIGRGLMVLVGIGTGGRWILIQAFLSFFSRDIDDVESDVTTMSNKMSKLANPFHFQINGTHLFLQSQLARVP